MSRRRPRLLLLLGATVAVIAFSIWGFGLVRGARRRPAIEAAAAASSPTPARPEKAELLRAAQAALALAASATAAAGDPPVTPAAPPVSPLALARDLHSDVCACTDRKCLDTVNERYGALVGRQAALDPRDNHAYLEVTRSTRPCIQRILDAEQARRTAGND